MDRHVPPRIVYWSHSFEFEMEAVAAEVACLRRAFPGSVTWGLSDRRLGLLSWKRGFSLHPRLHLLFRGTTWFMQRAFDVNHLFGGLGDWFHLTAVKKHPTVFTMVATEPVCDIRLLQKVDRFIAEWPAARDDLQRAGVDAQKIDLIFPPVELGRFRPADAPAGPFTVLFASSPEISEWLSSRGVDLLLDAARERPQMRFRLIWRPWGEGLPRVQEWIRQRELSNVEVIVGRFADMAVQYQNAHVTVAPFTRPEHCKPAPNSLVESLACGRPVVVTEKVGLADLIRDERVGLVCPETAAGLAESLDAIEGSWQAFSARARAIAEKWFDADQFVRSYARIYSELT